MTQIDPTTAAGLFGGQTNGVSETSLGKEDFLKLLVAQLKNQDPLNPSDATEFTAQLAQFSSLEQLFNVNKNLDGLSGMSSDMERLSALGLIGQDITAQDDQFHLSSGPVELGYRLEHSAASMDLYVLDATGNTVATLNGLQRTPGEYFLTWNGTTDSGSQAAPGNYFLAPVAKDLDDDTVSVTTLIKGVVDGVDFSDGQIQVHTTNGIFPVAKIEKAGAN